MRDSATLVVIRNMQHFRFLLANFKLLLVKVCGADDGLRRGRGMRGAMGVRPRCPLRERLTAVVAVVVVALVGSLRGVAVVVAGAARFNVPMFIEFNNGRVSQSNVTFMCVNELTGGQTPETVVAPFARAQLTVTPDPKYHVYAEITCYFYNNTADSTYLVAVDPWAGMGPNVDPNGVLNYEWNIGDACFDLIRHYVNGTTLTPCLYFWPRY